MLAISLAGCATIEAQVQPAATGPASKAVYSGNLLHYTLRYTESGEWGRVLGSWQTATAAGSLDYSTGKLRTPFTLNYSGGYNWTISGPDYTSGLFQNLWMSQGFSSAKWNLRLYDSVSYRHQSPTLDFFGIPGIGQQSGGSIPTTILTLRTRAVEDQGGASFDFDASKATKLSFGGSGYILRYPDGNGLSTNGIQANATLTQGHVSGRNSILVNYKFSRFSYPDDNFSFLTNSVLFGFQKNWSRKLSFSAQGGPEVLSSSNAQAIPTETRVSVNADVQYKSKFDTASLTYMRGTSGGSGYLVGAEADTIDARFDRTFRSKLIVGVTGGYARTAGLQSSVIIKNESGSAHVSRQLGRFVTVNADYRVYNQSSAAKLATNTVSDVLQGFSFGINYSPRGARLTQ